jgi:hypothetical protein
VFSYSNRWNQMNQEQRGEFVIRYLLFGAGVVVVLFFWASNDTGVAGTLLMITVLIFIAIPYRNEIGNAWSETKGKTIGEVLGLTPPKQDQEKEKPKGYTWGGSKRDAKR